MELKTSRLIRMTAINFTKYLAFIVVPITFYSLLFFVFDEHVRKWIIILTIPVGGLIYAAYYKAKVQMYREELKAKRDSLVIYKKKSVF